MIIAILLFSKRSQSIYSTRWEIESPFLINSSTFNLIKSPGLNGGALYINYFPKSSSYILNSHFIGCSADSGGAIYIYSAKSIIINYCVFEKNIGYLESGAMYGEYTNISIENSNFSYNQIDFDYYHHQYLDMIIIGAIINFDDSNFYIAGCLFNNNSMNDQEFFDLREILVYGGIFFFRYSNITFKNCLFKNNIVSIGKSSFSKSSLLNGGIIAIYYSNSTVNESYFEENTIFFSSSDIYGGGIFFFSSNSTVSHCFFNKNGVTLFNSSNIRSYSLTGGDIYSSHSNSTIENFHFRNCHTNFKRITGRVLYSSFLQKMIINKCIFTKNDFLENESKNKVETSGLLLYLQNSNVEINDCLFTENINYFSEYSASIIYTYNSNISFNNCSVVNNAIKEYDELYSYRDSIINIMSSDATIIKSIFNNNTGISIGVIFAYDSRCKFESCFFINNNAADCLDIFDVSYYQKDKNYWLMILNCTFIHNIIEEFDIWTEKLLIFHSSHNNSFVFKYNFVQIININRIYVIGNEYNGKNININCVIDKNCISPFEENFFKPINIKYYTNNKEIKFMNAFDKFDSIPSFPNDFNESIRFSDSTSFSESIRFSDSLSFSKSNQFSDSTSFSKSNQFSDSISFSKSNQFSDSTSFSKSNQFSNSIIFSESNLFSNSSSFGESYNNNYYYSFLRESSLFTKSLSLEHFNKPKKNSFNGKIKGIIIACVGVLIILIVLIIIIYLKHRKSIKVENECTDFSISVPYAIDEDNNFSRGL